MEVGATASEPSVALVTGGSRGIGRAIVQALARRGIRVHFTFLRDREKAEETAGMVREGGGTAEFSQLDVSEEAAVEAWSRSVLEREQRLDILVNNAGETADALLAFQETADWRRVLAVNLDGTRHACRSVLRPMIAQRRGRIVNLASVSALTGLEGQTAYAAAKGGVLSFTRSLAREVAPFGITANALVPGPVETEMWGSLTEERRAALLSQVPLGRAAHPEEVAAAAVYLATEASSYVTGTALRVDGGLAM